MRSYSVLIIRSLVILFFLLPFFVLISSVKNWQAVNQAELIQVLSQTLIQALVSAALTLALGVWGSLGLIGIKSKNLRRWAEVFMMLPSLLPSLFMIISALHFVSFLTTFPYGLPGVVLVHVIINVGLISVFLAQLLERRAGGLIELSAIEGASRGMILRQVLRSLKFELFSLAYAVFIFSFSSFSVPLIVGLDRGETLEVLIYRSLLGRGDLSSSVHYAFIQLIILAGLSFFVRSTTSPVVRDYRSVSYLKSPTALFTFLFLTAALLASNIFDFLKGMNEFFIHNHLQDQFWSNAWGTIEQSMGTGAATLIFFLLLAYVTPDKKISRFLYGYAAPSSVIVGLAVYLMVDTTTLHNSFVLALMAMAFALTILPTLYRLKVKNVFDEISKQIQMARILGASRLEIFSQITWPQISRDIFSVAGLAAFWASGDFALSSMISGRELTLAMSAHSYLGSYRMHLATVQAAWALLMGALVYFIFEGIGYVCHKKSHS